MTGSGLRALARPRRVVHAGAVVVALWLLATGCSVLGGDETTATTVPNGVRIVDLEPGSCYLAPTDTDVRIVEQVACREPHDAEAYAVFALPVPADGPFPGSAEVQSLAQLGCQDRFADYVGQAYEDSAYYFAAIAPTRKSWEDRGDRRVLCSIIASDGGRLEGSVAAAETDESQGGDG